MIIGKKNSYYAIHVILKSQESWCKIEKVSGKVYEDGHAHLEPIPFETEATTVKFSDIDFTELKH